MTTIRDTTKRFEYVIHKRNDARTNPNPCARRYCRKATMWLAARGMLYQFSCPRGQRRVSESETVRVSRGVVGSKDVAKWVWLSVNGRYKKAYLSSCSFKFPSRQLPTPFPIFRFPPAHGLRDKVCASSILSCRCLTATTRHLSMHLRVGRFLGIRGDAGAATHPLITRTICSRHRKP